MGHDARHAFTLVELLVAIAVIGMLAALTIGIAGSSSERAKRTQTEALMDTLAAVLDRYRQEVGDLPMATGTRSDPFPGASWTSWYPNGADGDWSAQALWWRLATPMDAEATRAARAAADAAWLVADPVHGRSEYSHLWRSTQIRESQMSWLQNQLIAVPDDAVADLQGPAASDGWWHGSGASPDFSTPQYGNVDIKLRGLAKMEYLRLGGMRAKRVWERAYTTQDLLGAADISTAMRDGDRLLDAWGNPLGYICTSDAGIAGRDKRNSDHLYVIMPVQLAPVGRAILSDRNGDGVVDTDDLTVEPSADERSDHNGDGTIDAADWGSLLWNALPGYERGYVLCSGGPDGRWGVVAGSEAAADDITHRGGVD